MRKQIAYFLLINFFCFAFIVGVCTVGEWYDKTYKLYPETVWISYDVSLHGQYGERWGRLMEGLLLIGFAVDIVTASVWYLKNQTRLEHNLSISNQSNI
jgi:hypothetical protein